MAKPDERRSDKTLADIRKEDKAKADKERATDRDQLDAETSTNKQDRQR